jgi:transketolase
MAAIANGIVAHGGLRPYVATFLTFSDYMRPSIRLACLMGLPVTYVFTHDSIGLGEDGPTHQPIEHLAALRAIPGLTVFRPADAGETAAAWPLALRSSTPFAMILSRQKLPALEGSSRERAGLGAYVLRDPASRLNIVLLATGSEVQIAVSASALLSADGINARVVSMPSWELFESQQAAYRDEVLPPGVPRVAVEAGATFGWERWTGRRDLVVGIDRFGTSAPFEEVFTEYGFTPERVADVARKALAARRDASGPGAG